MKTLTINHITSLLVMAILFAGCGGANGGSSSSTKDVPDYALGKTSYFASREGKGAHAFLGFADGRLGYDEYGMLDNGRNMAGMLVILNGKNVNLLYTSTNSFREYVIEDDSLHIMHVLWNDENPENPYNISLQGGTAMRGFSHKKVEGNYSDSYLFAKRKDVAEAVEYLNNLEKQPNQPSQFNPTEHGGIKTYKAKVGKQVDYFGNDSLDVKRFKSLYLDCGAVVEHKPQNIYSNFVGQTIDCVTDDNNKVIVYEFIKE